MSNPDPYAAGGGNGRPSPARQRPHPSPYQSPPHQRRQSPYPSPCQSLTRRRRQSRRQGLTRRQSFASMSSMPRQYRRPSKPGWHRAVEYWQAAIAADGGPALAAVGGAGKCALPAGQASHETDDLLVVVAMAEMPLDATTVGGVTIDNTPLALAYNCAYRANGLPYFGRVEFNDDENRHAGFGYNAVQHFPP